MINILICDGLLIQECSRMDCLSDCVSKCECEWNNITDKCRLFGKSGDNVIHNTSEACIRETDSKNNELQTGAYIVLGIICLSCMVLITSFFYTINKYCRDWQHNRKYEEIV